MKLPSFLLLPIVWVCLTACQPTSPELVFQCEQHRVRITHMDEHTLTLGFNNTTYTLTRQIRASGEKFENDTLLFWLKGESALLRTPDTQLQCERQG